MQDSGLALAYSLTGYLNLLLLGWTLRRQILHMDGTRVARTLVRTAIAAGIMALGVAVASTFLASWISGPTFVLRLLGLSLEIGVGTVLFILAAQRFHIEEYRMLVNHFRLRRRSVSST
jgi:peptidoglycan biosynthesis protein MviN/MurJ (putative lipid II flippase)